MNVTLDINICKKRLMDASSGVIVNYSCTSKGPKESNGSQVAVFKVSSSSNERGEERVGARNEKNNRRKKEATWAYNPYLGIYKGRG